MFSFFENLIGIGSTQGGLLFALMFVVVIVVMLNLFRKFLN